MDELYVDLAEMARMYSFQLTGQYSEGETEVQESGKEEQVEKEIVKKKKTIHTVLFFLNFHPLSKKNLYPHMKSLKGMETGLMIKCVKYWEGE